MTMTAHHSHWSSFPCLQAALPTYSPPSPSRRSECTARGRRGKCRSGARGSVRSPSTAEPTQKHGVAARWGGVASSAGSGGHGHRRGRRRWHRGLNCAAPALRLDHPATGERPPSAGWLPPPITARRPAGAPLTWRRLAAGASVGRGDHGRAGRAISERPSPPPPPPPPPGERGVRGGGVTKRPPVRASDKDG